MVFASRGDFCKSAIVPTRCPLHVPRVVVACAAVRHRTPPSFATSGTCALDLLRLARSTGCERFQHDLLERLLTHFQADHAAINIWHPRVFVSSVGIGYDLAAMSAQWNAINGAELDFITAAMRAQPERAVRANADDARWAHTPVVWREFLAGHDIHHQFGVAIPFEGSDTHAHLYLNRGVGSPPFGQGDVEALTALAPGIRESLLVNRLYAHARQGVDEGDTPLAVTDVQGWVLFPNSAFCRAWPELASLGRVSAPRLPAAWLRAAPAALGALRAAGWEIDTAPAEGGLRVALRRHSPDRHARKLTPRQSQIARLYCAGYSSKDVGTRLGLSPATVRVHLRNAYARAAVTNRASLRAWLADSN